MKKRRNTFVTVVLLLFGLMTALIHFLILRNQLFGKKTMNKGNLLNFFIDEGIEDNAARILVAQALHETGGFKSKLFKENNNLFGMKEAVKRPETADGTKNGHAFYSSWQESAEDLLLWLKYTGAFSTFGNGLKNLPSAEKYALWLKSKGYYEDTFINYQNGLNSWWKKI